MRIAKRFAALVGTFALVLVGFFALVRPWYLGWGATEREQTMGLPGDSIVAGAGSQNTRAITIQAPVERVWPWLAQIGQDRAGFYSYERLENLVGGEMPASRALLPGKQDWRPGDRLWMYPPHKAGGAGFATLRVLEPGRALGFATRMVGTPLRAAEDGSWSFALVPVDEATTRLLIRGRGAARDSMFLWAFDRAIFEPVHFVMERRMMIGLQRTVEVGAPSSLVDDLQVALWAAAFALIGVAKACVIFRRRWGGALAAFVASLVVFQLLTLVQPPVVLGTLLVVALSALLAGLPTGSSKSSRLAGPEIEESHDHPGELLEPRPGQDQPGAAFPDPRRPQPASAL